MNEAFFYRELSEQNVKNAIAKARKIKPRVRKIDTNKYAVQGSNQEYVVEFFIDALRGFGFRCGCMSHGACYHSAAAAGVHKALVMQRSAA